MRGSRLLVLGTYRDVELGRQHPLSQTLAELTREGLTQRILLRGLTEHDVERFIEITAGVKPPEALVDRRTCGGRLTVERRGLNPLSRLGQTSPG